MLRCHSPGCMHAQIVTATDSRGGSYNKYNCSKRPTKVVQL